MIHTAYIKQKIQIASAYFFLKYEYDKIINKNAQIVINNASIQH